MGRSKQAAGVGKIGARIDGTAERSDCLRITLVRKCDKGISKISPGFPWIT
jgi:hypothetical protein